MIIEVRRRAHVQRLSVEEFEERVRDGEITAATPVRFELLTGDAFVPAGDLEMFQELADPRRLEFRRRLLRRGVPLVTAALVGVQIRVYLWSWQPGASRWLERHLTNWPAAVLERGEVWRLLTYGFLHLGFTHLLFNLTFLAYAGYHLERALGRLNLAWLYLASVFAGGLLSLFVTPGQASLGASGGDFGLLAAAVVVGWKHWDAIPPRARRYYGWGLLPYPVISLLTGITAENVDNWSHLGGLVAGSLLATFLDPEVLPGRRRSNRRVRALSAVAAAGAAVFIALRGPALVPLSQEADEGWVFARPAYWSECWSTTGDSGWCSVVDDASFVAVDVVYHRPVDLDEAAEALVRRYGRGTARPVVLRREELRASGLAGRHIVLRADEAGVEHVVDATVFVRGVVEYRLVATVPAARARHYAPLVDRLRGAFAAGDPPELVRARSRAAMHPRSWSPACELGEALYRAGEPGEALRAFERALAIEPGNPRALVGLLRVYSDYGVAGGYDPALAALRAAPDDPAVVVAAAEVLDREGARDEAVAALDRAWAAMPGDVDLRKARLRFGLPVDDGLPLPRRAGRGAAAGGRD